MMLQEVDTLLKVDDRRPTESLLTTFGLDNSMRSGGVIMVVFVLLDVWLAVSSRAPAST